MNKTLAVVLGGIVASIVLAIVIAITSYVSANNYGASIETQLIAAKDDNKNILAQYEQKILEAAQVPTMYKDDFKEVVGGALKNRYGNNGANATVMWIKEHNIDFSPALYTKMQQLIESGRNDFANGQRKMIDIRREYQTSLGYVWRGAWMRLAGFPKVNFDEFQPVVTDRVETTFAKGKEDAPLKLR